MIMFLAQLIVYYYTSEYMDEFCKFLIKDIERPVQNTVYFTVIFVHSNLPHNPLSHCCSPGRPSLLRRGTEGGVK
jgi:hypothetical protein